MEKQLSEIIILKKTHNPNIFWDAETAKNLTPVCMPEQHLKSCKVAVLWNASAAFGQSLAFPPSPITGGSAGSNDLQAWAQARGCQAQQTHYDLPQPMTSPDPSTG